MARLKKPWPRLRDRLRDRPRRGRRLYDDDDELDEEEEDTMRLRVMRVDAGRRQECVLARASRLGPS